jgi:hypothetical protein
MSRHVVPAIVFVTLTIMFGSSFLVRRHDAQPRRETSQRVRLVTQAVPPK